MLKKFTVQNYKNFRNKVSIDFQNIAGYQFSTDCITDGLISKMLIYGRNATGKTNLGKALMDITSTLFGYHPVSDGIFLNADSDKDYASFTYQFQFGEHDVIYKYSKFSDRALHTEQLIVNKNPIFRCDFSMQNYDFDHLKYIGAETAIVDRYLQSLDTGDGAGELLKPRLPFLRWIISNVALKADALVLQLSNYVRRMTMMTVSNTIWSDSRRMYDAFFESLESKANLKEFEEFLNRMGIACRLTLKKLPDGLNELYFSHNRLVPFYENASSGTLALLQLYSSFISVVRTASCIYLDEFDAFYHHEMAENVIRFFKLKYPGCQIIMTSHNTNLMTNRLMRPDCVLILSETGALTTLCNATLRELREGHNLEKMYVNGEFGPYE